jgi:hypothetical protein
VNSQSNPAYDYGELGDHPEDVMPSFEIGFAERVERLRCIWRETKREILALLRTKYS